MGIEAIRTACADERGALVALMRRSSLVWESERAMLLAHPDVIDVPAEHIAAGQVRVALAGGRVVGFSAVVSVDDHTLELDGLFVEPDAMRTDVGRALVADAADAARRAGKRRIEVTANLNAQGFYQRVGFVPGATVATRFAPAIRMCRSIEPEE